MNLLYIWAKLIKKMRGSSLKNCQIDKTSKVESGSNLVNTVMRKHSFCGYDCEIANADIGSFCSIANNVVIGGGMHPMDWVSTSPVFYEGRDSVKAKFSEFAREAVQTTFIGHDVWIGQNALIKQGVTIGNGTVIGMGSVVTKDVPAYTIYAGNPAKFIRKRFNDEVIFRLEESRWWEVDEKRLKLCSKFIKTPKKFIECIKEKNGIS